MDQAAHVAARDVPVLTIGETGSGKEVLARALHERSRCTTHRDRREMLLGVAAAKFRRTTVSSEASPAE